MTLRKLIHELIALFNLALEEIEKGVKWLWNTMLDTPLSTYGYILFGIFIALVALAMFLCFLNVINGFFGRRPDPHYEACYQLGQQLRIRTKRLRQFRD